jgi:hypothetical protein
MTSNRDEWEKPSASSSNQGMHADPSSPVSPRPIDPERIAALIDGRLNAADRTALLAELEASPEAFEIYNDAVAALREGVTETAPGIPAGASPSRRMPRWFRTYAPVTALAAALAIAVALPLMRRAGRSGLEEPRALAALVEPTGDATTIWQRTPWNESRGSAEALSARARGVRIGAFIVDLEVLARARDTSATRIALQIASLLDAIPAGAVAASAYRSLASQGMGSASAEALGSAASFAEQVAGVSAVRVGAWIEAARMAAAQRNASFFQSMKREDVERAIASVPALPASARSAFAELTRLLDASPRDWPAVENALSALLREIADG